MLAGMKGLRQSIRAFVIAMAAALAVLFVTTAALAHGVVPDAPMMMSGDGMSAAAPCDDMEGGAGGDRGATICMQRCAVLCQALLVEPIAVSMVAAPMGTRRPGASFAVKPAIPDAEDPPPRP